MENKHVVLPLLLIQYLISMNSFTVFLLVAVPPELGVIGVKRRRLERVTSPQKCMWTPASCRWWRVRTESRPFAFIGWTPLKTLTTNRVSRGGTCYESEEDLLLFKV